MDGDLREVASALDLLAGEGVDHGEVVGGVREADPAASPFPDGLAQLRLGAGYPLRAPPMALEQMSLDTELSPLSFMSM